MKKVFFFGLMLAAGILFLNAADPAVEGSWRAVVPSPQGGEMVIIYNFNVEEETLTGTVTTDFGETQIMNGRKEGDRYLFEIDAGMGEPLFHSFRLEDDIIIMTVYLEGTPYDFSLERVEE